MVSAIRGQASHALVLKGVRRCGKSVLQSQLMRRNETAFYCNLEDTRLFGLSPADFPTLLSIIEQGLTVEVRPIWEWLLRDL